MVLDYIFCNRLYTQVTVSDALKILRDNLKGESIYGDKWLHVYESCRNKWIKGLNCVVNRSKFLEEALKNSIAFFNSPIV